MKAFVQIHSDGEFYSENFFSAWRAFEWFGYDVIKFKQEDVEYLDVSNETPCYANVDVQKRIFRLLDLNIKYISYYPKCLEKFLGREIKTTILENAVKLDGVFIKPTEEYTKFFDGTIWNKDKNDFNVTRHLRSFPDMPVYISEKIEIDAEYRVFIKDSLIIEGRAYKGDCHKGYDKDLVCDMISAFDKDKTAPKSYCLDIGLIQGKTKLIEFTDAWSFGNYGLNFVKFGEMIIARWNELNGILV